MFNAELPRLMQIMDCATKGSLSATSLLKKRIGCIIEGLEKEEVNIDRKHIENNIYDQRCAEIMYIKKKKGLKTWKMFVIG